MIISDRVYGEFEIKEPVIIELIKSKPIQRLKGISQSGSSKYAMYKPVTRYEHSVGVMILLRILSAGIEEQIAGLLHDIPHTAFSHTIDYVFKNKDHDYHERFHEKLVMESEIPSILKKHNFDVKRILDDKNFPLLERKIPDLCADRIDYTFRDWVSVFDDKVPKELLKHLIVHKNEIIFDNAKAAKKFSEIYLDRDDASWSNPKEMAMFEVTAQAIKLALEKGMLTEGDLFKDDDFVFNKLKNSGIAEITQKVNMLNPKFEIKEDSKDYDFHIVNKLRWVDPKFIENGELLKVSEKYSEIKERLKKHEKKVLAGHYIKVISW
jgi:hypothetical protein